MPPKKSLKENAEHAIEEIVFRVVIGLFTGTVGFFVGFRWFGHLGAGYVFGAALVAFLIGFALGGLANLDNWYGT